MAFCAGDGDWVCGGNISQIVVNRIACTMKRSVDCRILE